MTQPARMSCSPASRCVVAALLGCALLAAGCDAVKETVLLPVTITETVLGTNVRETVETAIDKQQSPDKYAYKDAKKANTEAAYTGFLAAYSESEYREKAEKELATVRAEDRKKRDTALLEALDAGDVAAARRALDGGATLEGAATLRKSGMQGHGTGLLQRAAGSGDLEMVALLLSHGADRNGTDQLGDTPLHAAAYGGHEDIVAALKAAGADVDKPNRSGLLYWEMGGLAEIERMIARAAPLIDAKNGSWSDERTGRQLYNALKRKPDRYVTYGLVRRVADREEERLPTLLLSIKLGLPDSARQLNELLMRVGNKSMAEDYLNSGSRELSSGGNAWARAHGYNIRRGAGSHRSSWGRF